MKKGLQQIPALILLVLALPLEAAEDVPELLLPGAQSWLARDGHLLIRLTPELIAANDQLYLELDAIDVTDMTRMEGDTLRYDPAQALDTGRHLLRLLRLRSDGNLDEVGSWPLEVRYSENFQQGHFSPRAEIEWQSLVSEHNIDPAPDHNVIHITAGFEGAWANPGYRLEANNSLVYDGSLEQDRLQLYDYRIQAETSPMSVLLGDQEIEARSLLIEDAQRRGLSGSILGDMGRLNAFALRNDNTAKLPDTLFPDGGAEMITGMTVRFSPWRNDPERLVLQTVLLEGQDSDPSDLQLDDGMPGEGKAWNLRLDSQLLDQRLSWHAEFARSRYDADGKGTDEDVADDRAWRLGIRYRPEGDGDLDWSSALQWQRVGSPFHSIANTGLPSDRELLRGNFDLVADSVSGSLMLGVEQDNVDDRPEFPTVRSHLLTFDLSYSPQMDEPIPLFANPELQFSYARIDNRQIDDPPLYQGEPIDTLNQDRSLTLGFSPDEWNWSIGYQVSEADDKTGASPSTRAVNVSLEAGVPVLDSLSASMALQKGREGDPSSGEREYTRAAQLGLVLAAEPVSATVDFGYNQDRIPQQDYELQERTLALRLDWSLLPARMDVPGVDFFIHAGWSDALGEAGTARQIFLGLRAAYAPDSHGGM